MTTKISDLKFSYRTLGRLQKAGIINLEQLASWCPAQLREIKGFGPTSIAEVVAALAAHDLQLSPDPPREGAADWEWGGLNPHFEEIKRLYVEEKWSYRQIAARYEVTQSSIFRMLKKRGVPARSKSEGMRAYLRLENE